MSHEEYLYGDVIRLVSNSGLPAYTYQRFDAKVTIDGIDMAEWLERYRKSLMRAEPKSQKNRDSVEEVPGTR